MRAPTHQGPGPSRFQTAFGRCLGRPPSLQRKGSHELKALGRHILVELYDCNPQIIDDLDAVKTHMVEAARRMGATVVGEIFHKFTPQGTSGAVVISESHLAIHTWPEIGFCAMDLFTCGDHVDPWVGFHYLREQFHARRISATELQRGMQAHATSMQGLTQAPIHAPVGAALYRVDQNNLTPRAFPGPARWRGPRSGGNGHNRGN